jgi:hypothetical protein
MNLMLPTPVWVTVMAPIGFGLGALYFAALRRTATLLVLESAIVPAIAFTAARGAAAIGVFGFAAWLGAGPLLSSFAGFLLARSSALHRSRRTE